ncbi:MAG: amino acid adenylation domain-containing protein [Nitrospira sp.]|nr:amino acid adenylation domain-containing protein [Nitrospira sp.]
MFKLPPRAIHSLPDLFELRCRQEPDRLAYALIRDNLEIESQLTYGQLERRVRSLAGHLARAVSPGTKALLLYPQGLEAVCAFWACVCAGVVPVPAPAPDPVRQKHSLPRLRSIIEDAQASLVLTTSGIQTLSSELSIAKGVGQIQWVTTDQPNDEVDSIELPCPPSTALAYLQYTSGSTAAPRGVMIRHGNVLAHCKALSLAGEVSDNSRSLCWLPYFHDYGLLHGIIAPFYAGIPAYLMSPITFLRRPLRWLEAVARFAITHSGGPNFSYEACLRTVRQQEGWQGDLSKWMVASCGAEPIHPDTVEQFIAIFGSRGFRSKAFAPGYGLAEATLLVTMKRAGAEPSFLHVDADSLADSIVKESPASQQRTRTLVGCGEPLEETHIRIVNPTTHRECPPDLVGEVWLAGAGVGSGYWDKPEETDTTFNATIAGSGEGPYLRTGDLGFLHCGELFLTGRLKDLIIVRGRNYYPQDLEWSAQQAHPGLRHGGGAAFSVEGETGELVVLVHEIEKQLPESNLREVVSCIRRALADEYELEIHRVVLVKSGTIPRTSSGKIQRGACRAAFESGRLAVVMASTLDLAPESETDGAPNETPQTPVEKRLADIWQEVLGGQHPHRHANFFALGGNSLLAAQVVARILDIFHVELPLSVLFECPTLSALAARIGQPSTSLNASDRAGEGDGYSNVDGGTGSSPVPLPSASPREGRIPLSPSQQRLWFLEQVRPGSAINHISMEVRLRGAVNPEVLERSVQEIARRHEILRTRFGSERGEGFAEVSSEAIVTIRRQDFQTLDPLEQEMQVRQFLRAERSRPFDLRQGPLFRVTLLALEPTVNVLALTVHRLVADGWSLRIFWKELALLWEAGGDVQGARLPTLTVQYADYADWQRARLDHGLREVHRAYWVRQLSGARSPAELPADRQRPRVRTFEGGLRSRSLSPKLSADLDLFCQQQNVTTFMVLYAVFATWLRRYTQESDIVIGSIVAGRRRREIEDMMGYCVNTVALRSELSNGMTGQELLKQVRRVVVDAYDHQDLPFEEVIEALSLHRERQLSPLFNVMIVCEDDPLSTFTVRDLEVAHLPWEPTASEFDLVLMVVNKADGLDLALLHDSTIFDDSTIDRMLGQLEILLEEFLAKPEAPLDQHSLLTTEEKRHIQLTWNEPRHSASGIHALIEAQVDRTPHAPAVTCGDQSISYQELNRRANRVARALQKLGVVPDLPVGLCVERSVDALVGLLGILKAGGGYVPLDPSFPSHRLQLMLEDAQVSIVVTQAHLRTHLQSYRGQICDLETLCTSTLGGAEEENLALPVSPDQLAYIIYTSGSTGHPKGVAVPHRGLVTSLQARLQYYQEPVSRFLLTFSLAFDGSVTGIFWTLLQGGELVIPSETAHRDPTELATLIEHHRISHIVWVPSLYRVVLGEVLSTQLESLLVVITAGENLPLELVQRHYQLLPHAVLYNEYGPTETTVWCSVYQTTREETGARVPIGKPIDHMQLYVLDGRLQPMPIDVPGELYISGECLARGYVNQPQLTQERFLANPFVAGTRLYRTGDLARYRADGNVEFLGRVDQQVKLRGYRIELGEIEYVLSNFPGVHQAAALLREDKPEQHRLVGYVAGEPSLRETLDQVRSHLAARLPHYMVPSVILWLETMPLSATGKVNRHALPTPELTAGRAAARIAPRNQVEESLAELWKSVLQVPEAGIHDHFFEQGGHSLVATQLVSRIHELFEVDVSLQALFERPTIAALAEEVIRLRQREKASVMPPIVSVPRDQPLPLSYSQQRMWLMHQLAPQSTAYNMPFASRQMGRLNKAALRSTIDAICSRHEAFRTTFMMRGDGPVQVIHPFRSPHWTEVDLQDVPLEHRRQQAARLVEQEANQPFDLEKGPLARFLLIEIEPEDYVLVLTMHHIIGDQWSFGIIGYEFAFFYNAFSQGEMPAPKAIPLQYADYAVWQRRCLTDDRLSTQSDYWQKKLAGLPKLSLPTDYTRHLVQTFNGSHRMLELPTSLIERLKQFSAEHNVTVFMTLLACFQILLSRYSGQFDVAVGSPIANRTQSAVESIIGSFVNTLVLRTDLSGDPTFIELMARVRETALEAYANQDFPFDKLVETMHSARDHSSAPLVQVLFNVPNAPIGEINVQGLSWVPFEVETQAAQFDLSLTIETEFSRKAYLTFNTDLFEPQTAERMLGQYKVLLLTALANPDSKLSELPTVTAIERRQMLQDWNRTQRDYPQSECFPQLFEAQVERTPDTVALSMGREVLRYGELNARANQLARYLQTLGAKPGVTVGIGLERSFEMVIALMAVMKSGAAYVPLDPDYPRDRLRYMSENASLAIVLTSEALADRFDAQVCRRVCLDRESGRIARESDHNVPPSATPHDLAYILYTSGSTGQPKGVEIPHQALVNFLCSIRQEPGCLPEDVMLSVTTLSFDIAGLELYVPLLVGARVEIADRAVAMDGRQLRVLCEAVQPTIMQATPATWRMLVEAGWQGSNRLTVLCGGEPLPPDLATLLLDRSVALWNMYGPTETTIWSTIERIERSDGEITIGRPIANTEVYILDQFLQPVPIGVSGELYIGGHGLARGYCGRPDLTQERFIPHPFSQEPARLYRTGDSARYRPDGRIVHLGRLDHQVKIRGFRIELGEIETALNRHHAVRQTVVIARDDDHGVKQLVAYLVCQEGSIPSQPELRAFLRAEIPEYMVPSLFVFLKAMPLTANNKVDRKALPAPDSTRASSPVHVAPRDRMEIQMAALWQQVFEVDKVGIHDNFFDLGGHSLKAAQLFHLIEQVFARHLPLSTLFQAPTIAGLTSLLVEEHRTPPWQSLVTLQLGRSAAPVFLVSAAAGGVLWYAQLARLLGQAHPVYGLQARGYDGTAEPYDSMYEIARHYIAELRSRHPHGPYVIVGICTGGLVAYEMAQQLAEQNQEVTLVIANSWHPTSYTSYKYSYDLPAALAFPLEILSVTLSACGELRRMPITQWGQVLKYHGSLLLSRLRQPAPKEPVELRYNHMRLAIFRAAARYTIRPYRGHILNIVAAKRIMEHDTRRVWSELAAEGCRTVEIATRRTTDLLISPHVEEISSHIRRYIAERSLDAPRPHNRAA